MKFFDYILKAFIKDKDKAGTVARPVHHPNVVHCCPECGVRARFHVTDITKGGEVVAQAFICDEHRMYFIIADRAYNPPELFEQMAVHSIHEGTVTSTTD